MPGQRQLKTTDPFYTAASVIWILAALMLFAGTASAQTASAGLTYPPPGATNVDIFHPFTWTPVLNAQVYYIYVGTTPGAKDIFDSGEIPSTVTSMYVWGMLPSNTYYVDFWTKMNGVWTFTEGAIQTALPDPLPDKASFYSLIESLTTQVRGMTQGESNSPTPGTPLDAEVSQRGYNTDADCVDYSDTLIGLLLNNRLPARERSSSFNGTVTEGHTVVEYYDPFLQKWDLADPTFGVVYFNDATQQGQSLGDLGNLIAQKNFGGIFAKYVTANGTDYIRNYYMDPWTDFLNPVPLGSSALPVQNDPHPYLTQHTLAEVQGVPGVVLFEFASARDTVQIVDPQTGPVSLGPQANSLWGTAKHLNQGWWYNAVPASLKVYTFPRFWTHSASLLTPPNPGPGVASQNPTTPIFFTWTGIAGAQAYYVYVGTTQGAKDVYNSGELSNTWLPIQIPPHALEYVRMWTKYNGVWTYQDTSFQTGPLTSRLLTPANNAANVDPSLPVQFSWTSVPEAQTYSLYVGTSYGGQDVYSSGEITTTNLFLHLQPNEQYFVRLWTKETSGWYYSDSSLRTNSGIARLITPANNAVNVDPSLPVQFSWTSVPNVQTYYLYVGSSVGAKDFYDSSEIQTTSLSFPLQSSKQYYVRLWTKVGGTWNYSDTTFQTSTGIARLISPANGATGVSSSVVFRWSSVSDTQTYYLYVGSSPGATDAYDSGQISVTSLAIKLQLNTTYYVRLWTEKAGNWYYSDSIFQTGGI